MNTRILERKIARIIEMLADRRKISSEEALRLFYESRTCENLHDPETGLYLLSDLYILNDLEKELAE